MTNIFSEKVRKNSSNAVANETGALQGKKMPAVPALQKKEGAEEELPIQKKGGPEEEEPLQMKGGPEEEEPLQMKGGPEEEEPLQMKGGPEEEEPLQMKGGPEEEEPLQMKGGPEEELPVQGKFVVQKKSNNTGLPDTLKSGVENLSGMSMDHVKVHYNSSQPAQLNALAYAQGSDIHVAPGQEKHLPHEAWHVVQQMQGRVRPTMQMKESVPVNDDAGLESEADVMGAKALQLKASGSHGKSCCCSSCTATQLKAKSTTDNTIQRAVNVAINTHTSTAPASTTSVAQLTTANISVNGANRGTGNCGIGEGAGGVSHAEQRAWATARANVDTRFVAKEVKNVIVSFDVDQKICSLCQDWFETTVYDYLATKSEANKDKLFELWVEVDGTKVRVRGAGETDWPGEAADEERGYELDELKEALTTTGGFQEDKIIVYDEEGRETEYPYYHEEELDDLLKEHRIEIKESMRNWKNFQNSGGMVLIGGRREINFTELHDNQNDEFEGDYRDAH